MLRKLSLRYRIFFAMILLVVIAWILISAITVYQYREQLQDYHENRLERKEQQIKQSLNYTLHETTYPVTTENLGLIFSEEIYVIADVHNKNFNIYDLEGQLIKSSRPKFDNESVPACLDAKVMNSLEASVTKR